MEIKNKRQAVQVLANIVSTRPTELKDALFESGVDISPNATDRQLIESVISNVGRNRMLQDKLSSLSHTADFVNTEGGFFSDSANVAMVGNAVGEALGFWLGARREKQNAKLQKDLLTQQQELAKINADLVEKQIALEQAKLGGNSGMPRGAKIAIFSVLGLITIGTVIYFITKK